jgi:protein TonB
LIIFSFSSILLFGQETNEIVEIDTITTINNEVVDSSKTYRSDEIQELPEYPGGMPAFKKYIKDNLKYPSIAIEESIQGKVYIQFNIELDGKVTKVKVLRSLHPLLDEEAVRLITNCQNWKPGKLDGQTVRSKMTVPIVFKLN